MFGRALALTALMTAPLAAADAADYFSFRHANPLPFGNRHCNPAGATIPWPVNWAIDLAWGDEGSGEHMLGGVATSGPACPHIVDGMSNNYYGDVSLQLLGLGLCTLTFTDWKGRTASITIHAKNWTLADAKRLLCDETTVSRYTPDKRFRCTQGPGHPAFPNHKLYTWMPEDPRPTKCGSDGSRETTDKIEQPDDDDRPAPVLPVPARPVPIPPGPVLPTMGPAGAGTGSDVASGNSAVCYRYEGNCGGPGNRFGCRATEREGLCRGGFPDGGKERFIECDVDAACAAAAGSEGAEGAE